MKRYRKKPVVIEAARWDGTSEGATPIIDWILSWGGTARYHEAEKPWKLHTVYCRCDGRGIVPGTDRTAISCPETEPKGPDVPAHIAIDTLEGTMVASVGSFVIKGVADEFYACEPNIFWQTYEEA